MDLGTLGRDPPNTHTYARKGLLFSFPLSLLLVFTRIDLGLLGFLQVSMSTIAPLARCRCESGGQEWCLGGPQPCESSALLLAVAVLRD